MPFHLFPHKFEEFQINYAPKTLQKRVRALEQEKKQLAENGEKARFNLEQTLKKTIRESDAYKKENENFSQTRIIAKRSHLDTGKR